MQFLHGSATVMRALRDKSGYRTYRMYGFTRNECSTKLTEIHLSTEGCFIFYKTRKWELTMETKKSNKKIIIAAVALVAVVAILAACYFAFAPKGSAGSKTIAIQVVYADATSKDFTIKTDAEMLGDALLAEKLVVGEKGEYGLFITSVDGVAADAAKKEWWMITKAGEQVNTGADTTPIADGDVFELTLSTY